ncbi:unnamed protein product [Acanthoscelides obtectus]|uniref:Uncharacterized protein n=1 Tax=Acanthoscelides obtectus TaxID=200917 RepID=A0A9P0PPD7_ACAOB|nr:unnamed protein product [Acanthoscelides obtectus]CAH1993805.1 unnamed protein product [Acanthoscelides obtectus]CAK1626218.1 hypothetical protein AOBTE_LOCUS3687 [Acanthoscelides obtectus]CAK1684201.1 hypothetical protein AOBTE_LOCUS34700 [Acanthoscelides obtectus]
MNRGFTVMNQKINDSRLFGCSKINPERRIILHQDNASSRTAQQTRQF